MPKICYAPKKFRAKTLAMIDKANEIIAEYQAQGYSLTLRQIYYQFVARGLIANTERSYKQIGSVINDARMAGLIDWYSIEDRTRWLRARSHWDSPAEIVRGCAAQFHIDMWENQEYRPEVWIEKDALVGVIEKVCQKWDVPFFACRGYVSQSEVWSAGQRMLRHGGAGQMPLLIHLGDHDPSGMDMTRDNEDRLTLFAQMGIEVKRIALNMDQVEEYNPPPNPAKFTDSRAAEYVAEYGNESWELDALEPKVIERLILDEIEAIRDTDAWDEREEKREAGRALLRTVADELTERE